MALAYSARPRGLPSRCANRGEGGVEAAGQREKLGEGGVYVGRRRPVMRQARRSLVVPGQFSRSRAGGTGVSAARVSRPHRAGTGHLSLERRAALHA